MMVLEMSATCESPHIVDPSTAGPNVIQPLVALSLVILLCIPSAYMLELLLSFLTPVGTPSTLRRTPEASRPQTLGRALETLLLGMSEVLPGSRTGPLADGAVLGRVGD